MPDENAKDKREAKMCNKPVAVLFQKLKYIFFWEGSNVKMYKITRESFFIKLYNTQQVGLNGKCKY